MPGAARRLAISAALAAAASAILLAAAARSRPTPPVRQDETFDFRSVPSAPEYRTDVPGEPGFLGSDAAVLGRSLARINKALGTTLRPDGRLARLARWVYDRFSPEWSMPPQSAFDLLASRLGLAEPLPHIFMIKARDAPQLANVVSARLARIFDLADYTHIGGVAEREASGVVVVIVISRRHVELAPVPRTLPAPGRIVLKGRLIGLYAKPQLAHALPSGETELTPLGLGPGFETTVDLAEAGRHRLEVVAESAHGPDVVANFPVYVAVPVDETVEPVAAPKRALRPDEVRERLLELINADRTQAGLEALAFDAEAAPVALAHSEDMRRNDFVGHVSPTTGGPDQRLQAAGLVTSLTAECVGKGYSPDEIHKGFMDSPGHRAAILLPGATHVGIGVVAAREGDRTTYFVSELFIRRIPALPDDARVLFLAELNLRREEAGSPKLKEDAELRRLADETAREFLADQALTEKEVMARLREWLSGFKAKSGTITAVISIVDSLEEGARRAAADARAEKARRVGLGLAQGARPGLPPNTIVLVLIYVD